jgi:hypothetical protein
MTRHTDGRRWEVVQQISQQPDQSVRWHRFGWLAELHAHRLQNREQDGGVFYNAYRREQP